MTKFFTRPGVNLDITNRCSLRCPACTRRYITEAGMKIPGYDMSDQEFDMMLRFFYHFTLCGNVSDPIFHPKFIEFMEKLYKNDKEVSVHTAASQKPLEWYKRAFKANPNAIWNFGIDGLPHQSFLYRKNQDGEKLFKVMKMCREMGLKTYWQYLIFSYNEDNIEEARQMAKEIDVEFILMKTSRFPYGQDWFKPRNEEYVQRL